MLVLSSQLFLLKKSRLKQVFSWLSLTVGSYFDLSLVLFSTRIQKEKDKKVDWVSVNDGFSNDLKTIHFVENLGMTYVTGGGGSCHLRQYDAICEEIDALLTLEKVVLKNSVKSTIKYLK